jgi:hypothetical protein
MSELKPVEVGAIMWAEDESVSGWVVVGPHSFGYRQVEDDPLHDCWCLKAVTKPGLQTQPVVYGYSWPYFTRQLSYRPIPDEILALAMRWRLSQ